MLLRQLFDPDSSTFTYLVADAQHRVAALIDPVLGHVERDLKLVAELSLELAFVLDTHVHADHVTAAHELRKRTGARTAASAVGAPCVDLKLTHDDEVQIGSFSLRALATPGHTDDSTCFVVRRDAHTYLFTGDTLLVRGTGRTDFQNGSAMALHDSITRTLFSFDDAAGVLPGHTTKASRARSLGKSDGTTRASRGSLAKSSSRS